MRGQSSLLPVQLDRIAEDAERPAGPRHLGGGQLRQLQQLQSLRQRLGVRLGARAAARHVLRLRLLHVCLVVVLRNAEHGEVSPQSEVRGDDPGVLVADLDHHLGIGALDAVPLTRVAAAVVALREGCVLAQRDHHVQSVAHGFEADAEQLQTFYVRESEVHLRDQLQPFHPPEIARSILV